MVARHRFRGPLIRVASLLLATAVLACGNEIEDPVDATGSNLGELVGTWSATTLEYRSPVDSTLAVDLSGTLTVTIEEDGAFAWNRQAGDVIVNPLFGTLEVEGDRLTLVFEHRNVDPITFRFELSDDVLYLRADEGIEWDLDDDGQREDAILVVVLERV